MYLKWNEKTITDFSDENINSLYNEGYVLTRLGKGIMHQTRSLRIDLAKFELSSENRRILKKTEEIKLKTKDIPYSEYHWLIGKMAKDFYDKKFSAGVFTANKIKELLTDKEKSNFNSLFVYNLGENNIAGYAICFANNKIVHYSYPFYSLVSSPPARHASPPANRLTPQGGWRAGLQGVAGRYNLVPNMGMGMMIMAISAAKQNNKQYIYLGSAQRPADIYKLQFAGLEWFDKEKWNDDIKELKKILKI